MATAKKPAKAKKKPSRKRRDPKATGKKKHPALNLKNLETKSRGHPGNNYAEKFPTPESRADLFKKIIAHLESGLSRDCFPYCDWETVERYCEVYPTEFGADKIAEAIKKGRLFWEQLGKLGAAGKVKNFNATAWKFNMQNRTRDGRAGDAAGRWHEKIEVESTPPTKPGTGTATLHLSEEQAAALYNKAIRDVGTE